MKKLTQLSLLILCIALLGNLPVKAQTTSLFFTETLSKVSTYTFKPSGDVLNTLNPKDFSTNTSNVCNGAIYKCQFTEFILELKSTSASAFVFHGTSSASVRTIKEFAVCDTRDGEYVLVTTGTKESNINDKDNCGRASISGISIPQGKFVKILFSGGVNLSCIEITPVSSSDVKYVLTTSVQPDASAGTIVCNPEGTTVAGGAEYAENELVTLTATPSSGYEFVRWTDMGAEDTNATNPERTISMTEAKSVMALFGTDATAPQLVSTSPADGGIITLISTTTGTETVILTFDEAVQIVNANGITVNGVPVAATLSNNDIEITFDVNIDIDNTETYTIAIADDAIKDLNGNSLAATSFTFTAEASDDAPLLYSLNSSDIAANGKPDWIVNDDNKISVVSASSYGSCVTGSVLKVESGKEAKINLEKCGRLILTLGATGTSNVTVKVGSTVFPTKSIAKNNNCVDNIIDFDVNSCESVVVSLIGSSSFAICDVKAYDYTCYGLTVNECENGNITVSPESESGLYPKNAEVTLAAIPEAGYIFAGWTGHLLDVTEGSTVIVMDADKTVGATFQVQATTGVEGSVAVKDIASVKYFTPTGIEVDSTVKGVVIVKTIYKDGSVETSKEIKR